MGLDPAENRRKREKEKAEKERAEIPPLQPDFPFTVQPFDPMTFELDREPVKAPPAAPAPPPG